MASTAARSAIRAASRSSLAAKTKPSASSPFQIPKQTPKTRLTTHTSFRRSAMETSRCMGSMHPYHTATASALLNSMLSLSNPIFTWTPEGVSEEEGDGQDEPSGSIGVEGMDIEENPSSSNNGLENGIRYNQCMTPKQVFQRLLLSRRFCEKRKLVQEEFKLKRMKLSRAPIMSIERSVLG